ncbi:dihydrodipicolinate synthase family protein [Thermostaphylospora chromogena]|uniref:4-hydroxy-tetrahydrodipicolinate synthase n=1 Tax=Thermostaphylospora chromogena TaxID=35622 RepID=A0A1H1GR20_9ACTN|nr:dihydrodipicolinate synthase family protein [Thermostaphylospora chromogena]SDR15625.1 4-hydroxy-tetrahydrodipicolinate synthase [Thermostaphylospora chromogena]
MLQPGVWGVVATPFTGSTFDVDEQSLARLVEHYEQTGVTGLTVLGVFGEAARLSSEERRAVLETVVDTVELSLVVGATSLATAPVVEEVRLAQEVVGDRLAGAMVQVNSADPHVLANHLRAVHEATGANVVVQDYPLVSGVRISADALVAALRGLDFVVAVKAEAPPTPVAVAALTSALDVPVFGGLGGIGLLDELACGAAGAMTGFSFPEGLVACVEAWRKGGYEAAREAWLPYLPLVNFEQQAGVALAIRKECLRQRGLLLESGVRPPAASLPESLHDQLKRHLAAVK